MYYEFYIDVFFVVNLEMDFLVLCLTNELSEGAAKPLRALWGAFLGAVGSCIFLWLTWGKPGNRIVILHGILSLLMIWAGCGFHTLKGLLYRICAFYGVSFLLGGALSIFPEEIRRGIFTFFTITITAYLILNIGIRLFKYLKGKASVQCRVVLELNGRKMKVKGLYDTGNRLFDRESGKPVSVMDYNCLVELLSEPQKQALARFCTMKEPQEEYLGEEIKNLRPRFLLYTSVGCQRGLLPIVNIDSMTFWSGDEKRQVKNPVVGISKTALSPYGNFQIIINPEI